MERFHFNWMVAFLDFNQELEILVEYNKAFRSILYFNGRY